jgi:hypothetical protein
MGLGLVGAVGLIVYIKHQRAERVPDRVAASESRPTPLAENDNPVGAYVTALLSIIAIDGRSETLVKGRLVPRLEDLTRDPNLLAWRSKLPSDYADRLPADYVMGVILGFAKWPTPNDREISTDLHAQLLRDGHMENFTFSLKMTTVGTDARRLEIRPGTRAD